MNTTLDKYRSIFQRVISNPIGYIVFLFLLTRSVLLIVGYFAYIYLPAFPGRLPWHTYSKSIFLDIWGVWDSGWYVQIATDGYHSIAGTIDGYSAQHDIAFFPLYPALMHLVGLLIGDNFLAGVIISNAALILACWMLFKLVRFDTLIETSDYTFSTDSAKQAVKYLYLFPTAFVFSGVFTEASFLLLAISAIYFSRKGNWLLAAFAGFLASLTRSIGVFLIFPMLWEYLSSINFSPRRIRPNILMLGLVPAGLLAYMVYNKTHTGDYLAFAHIQTTWARSLANPAVTLVQALCFGSLHERFASLATFAAIILPVLNYRKLRISYLVITAYSILIPLSTGIMAMPRYLLAAFPLYILMGKLAHKRNVDLWLTISCAIAQAILMSFWTVGSLMVM